MTNANLGNRSDRGQDLFKGMTKKKKAKADKKATQAQIQVGEHGRYQIKSGLLAGKFVARAFAKPPSQARGLIAEATGETEEAAITALHDAIDTRESRRIEDRRKDELTGMSVPSIEEYAEALGHVSLTQPQHAMLVALSLADEDGLTDMQLAHAAGYKSLASATRSLSNAGRLFAEFFAPDTTASPEPDSNSLVAYRREPKYDSDAGNWTVYPELSDAVRDIT